MHSMSPATHLPVRRSGENLSAAFMVINLLKSVCWEGRGIETSDDRMGATREETQDVAVAIATH